MPENQNVMIARCPNGHFYNQAQYAACPYCIKAKENSEPLNNSQAMEFTLPSVSVDDNMQTEIKPENQIPEPSKPVRTCAKCGAELEDDANFCIQCGAAVNIAESEDIIRCPKCGAELEDDAKFCMHCGAAVNVAELKKKRKCPKCGALLDAEYSFCNKCGNPINKQEYASSPSANTPNTGENINNVESSDKKQKKIVIPIIIATAAIIILGSILIALIITFKFLLN